MGLKEQNDIASQRHVQWVIMENENVYSSESLQSIAIKEEEESANSLELSSSSSSSIGMAEDDDDDEDEASSSSTSSNGPLYELSELMAQLPIKRGLSKYYEGKSMSFGSLGSVKSLEDLAKKGNSCCYNQRMKSCKSFAGGLDSRRSSFGPKATIRKKSSSTRPILLATNSISLGKNS